MALLVRGCRDAAVGCVWRGGGKTRHAHTAARTDTHTPVFEILQYRGQGKQNTPPSPPQVHTRHLLAGEIVAKIHDASNLPVSQNPAFQSKLLYRQTLWFQPFHGKSGKRERGKYKSLILSHKMYTCTHDFNAHRQNETLFFIICARTHSLGQFITLNVLRSTDKKGKKALGIGLISGCLVKERRREVERAGGMGS